MNKLVTDLVNLDRVRSLLKTISYRRRFLEYLERKRAEKLEQGTSNCCISSEAVINRSYSIFSTEIPSIVVEDMPGTPPLSSRDISSAGYEFSPGSPTPVDIRFSHSDYSVAMDHSGPKLQRSSRRLSGYSTFSADTTRSPYDLLSHKMNLTDLDLSCLLYSQSYVTCR